MNINEMFGLPNANVDMSNIASQRIAYDANGNVEYIGFAPPGSEEDQSVWLIKKIVYDGSSRVTQILYSNGNLNFNNAWDDRATITYK